MTEHLEEFNQILADLLNLDEEIKDEDKALLLLNSLPEECDHLAMTLMYGKRTIGYEEVANALMGNEIRKKDKEAHREKTDALVVRGRTGGRNFGGSGRGKSREKSRGPSGEWRPAFDQCAHCRKKGHWKRDCPDLIEEEDDPKAAIAREEDDEYLALVSSAFVAESGGWILDSGCSYHMCPNRERFSSFRRLDEGPVFMGNGAACRAVGIGQVKLRLRDGSIHTLEDVRYVPALKKNLISLGTLDSKGYRVAIEGGAMRVSRGAMVALRGTCRRGLYFLEGSTVMGGAATMKRKTTKVWRPRVSHVAEKRHELVNALRKGAKTGKRVSFLEPVDMNTSTNVNVCASRIVEVKPSTNVNVVARKTVDVKTGTNVNVGASKIVDVNVDANDSMDVNVGASIDVDVEEGNGPRKKVDKTRVDPWKRMVPEAKAQRRLGLVNLKRN